MILGDGTVKPLPTGVPTWVLMENVSRSYQSAESQDPEVIVEL